MKTGFIILIVIMIIAFGGIAAYLMTSTTATGTSSTPASASSGTPAVASNASASQFPAFSAPTINTTAWAVEGDQSTNYLDRHDMDCGTNAINSLHLVRSNPNGTFHYEYGCSSGGGITTPVSGTTPLAANTKQSMGLSNHTIDCGAGSVLTELQYKSDDANNQNHYRYMCAPTKKPLTCRNVQTALTDNGGGSIIYLDRQSLQCNPNEAMSKVRLVNGADGKTIQYNYTCCA
jgi:hypothetical protein